MGASLPFLFEMTSSIFLDFAERMKRKALRVRSEGSIPPYVTKAESRKQQKTNYYHAGAAGRVGVRDRGATPHRVYGRVR